MKHTVTIQIEPEFLHELAAARGDLDTRSEVVLILPRPSGKVITTRKPFYPDGVYRVPTGGIHPGETPEQAFAREAMEETGLEVVPEAKIAEVLNHCVAGSESIDITSHIFLAPVTWQAPRVLDPDEEIDDYGEADTRELIEIADRLDHLSGKWTGWGHFRATAHRLAAGCLEGNR